MKKVFISFITLMVIFNFIFCNPIYATDPDIEESEETSESSESSDNNGSYKDSFDQISQGTATNTYEDGQTEEVSTQNQSPSFLGTIMGYFAKIFNIFPMLCHVLFTVVLEAGGVIEEHRAPDDTLSVFSIEGIIFGKYLLLDVDIFTDVSNSGYTINYPAASGMEGTLNDFRTNVSLWFIIIRDLALAVNLGMLLYVAIRLAIATVASDKAKYKEFLYNWVVSIIIIFTIQYILIFFNAASNTLTGIARNMKDSLESSGNVSFESTIINSMYSFLNKNGGLRVVFYSLIYWILFWVELKFLLMYLKRMLKMVFLVIISPIITFTYSADKIGDGKAQAFTAWMKEYISNLLVQPLHCFIYLVFMFMSNNIAIRAPLVGVVFLLSLTKSEQIIKSVLGVVGVENVGDQLSMSSFKDKLRGLVPKAGPKPGMPRG